MSHPTANLRLCLLAVLTACVALTGRPSPAADLAKFQEDPRLSIAVTAGRGIRTIKQLVVELNRTQERVRLSSEPRLDADAITVWVKERPLVEVLEAVAVAGQYAWKPTAQGYELCPQEAPSATRSPLGKPLAPGTAPAYEAKLSWPPLFPDLEQVPPKFPDFPLKADEYSPGSFGAALVQLALKTGGSVVAVSPMLRSEVRFTERVPSGATVPCRDVLMRISALEGAEWRPVGEIVTLVQRPEVHAIRVLPEDERVRRMGSEVKAFIGGLATGQLAELRAGKTVGFSQLTPTQVGQLRRIVQFHHARFPLHEMKLLDEPKGWNITPEKSGVVFFLAPGRNAPVVEWSWERLAAPGTL